MGFPGLAHPVGAGGGDSRPALWLGALGWALCPATHSGLVLLCLQGLSGCEGFTLEPGLHPMGSWQELLWTWMLVGQRPPFRASHGKEILEPGVSLGAKEEWAWPLWPSRRPPNCHITWSVLPGGQAWSAGVPLRKC